LLIPIRECCDTSLITVLTISIFCCITNYTSYLRACSSTKVNSMAIKELTHYRQTFMHNTNEYRLVKHYAVYFSENVKPNITQYKAAA